MTYTALQQIALIVLRTLIGWHFLYQGLTKLLHPAWTRAGAPATAWSSAGYLKGATGPLADVFHSLGNASWIGSLDLVIAGRARGSGTELDAWLPDATGLRRRVRSALDVLSVGHSAGLPEARAEGTYLLVNKNLVEAAAVGVLFAFRTGRIAGLDQVVEPLARGRVPASMHEARLMNLTPEQMAEGRRNFLKALAGTPALAALGVSAALRGPVPGGPVRLAFIGVGAQGRSPAGCR